MPTPFVFALLALLAFSASPAVAQNDSVIRIDGSSTVYPISTEAARRYGRRDDITKIEVKFSGTTAGFRRFCAGETDISDASRPINREELAKCESNKVKFIELPIAFDAIAIVVNGENKWANDISVAELKTLWEPAADGKVTTWKQVRAGWPDRPIKLFGRGQDSGTYDYFTSVIVGKTRASRKDYTASENEQVLVDGVMNEPGGLAFFGVGGYFRNWEELKNLGIKTEEGVIYPSLEAVRAGKYQPLARPLFLYVNAERAKAKSGVNSLNVFVTDYISNLRRWVHFTGYMPLTPDTYARVLKHFTAGKEGTAFGGELQVGARIEDVFK
jgi:phosphate transport system substrate-binding protein